MSNGCGCERGLLKHIKPPLSKMFYVACCIHDDDYDMGGDRAARRTADVTFYRNMCRIISGKDVTPWRSFGYTAAALLYYACVRIFGRFYFRFI